MLAILVAAMHATLFVKGATYDVLLDPSARRPLQVWRSGRKVDETLRSAFNPWKLAIANVSGSEDDIVVGLNKKTHNLPFRHRTLFVMRFDGKTIWKKWAGSTMGRPLLDFCFSGPDERHVQTLFTLERRLDGRVELTANRWSGFGFRKVGKPMVWHVAHSLYFREGKLILRADGRTVEMSMDDLR